MSVRCLVALVFLWGCKKEPARGTPTVALDAVLATAPVDAPTVDVAIAADAMMLEGDPAELPATNRRPGADLGTQIQAVKAPRIEIVDKMVYGETSVTLDEAAEVVQRLARGDLGTCYRRALDDKPGVRGHLIASFALDAKGAVVEPSVKAFDQALANCARETVRTWRFPAPAQAKSARYTFKIALGTE
jgi:hypothetical protein